MKARDGNSKNSMRTRSNVSVSESKIRDRSDVSRVRKTRARQSTMIAREKSEYGGDLLKTRAGRRGPRPLSTRETMHLVLRSTKARGAMSFLNGRHKLSIDRILKKFSAKYGVKILSYANAGNHLHLQLKLSSRHTYRPFIRAITGAIAMAITGRTRWTKISAKLAKIDEVTSEMNTSEVKTKRSVSDGTKTATSRFWDQRPFTRIVKSFAAFKNLKNYVRLNQIESEGYSRTEARAMVEAERILWGDG